MTSSKNANLKHKMKNFKNLNSSKLDKILVSIQVIFGLFFVCLFVYFTKDVWTKYTRHDTTTTTNFQEHKNEKKKLPCLSFIAKSPFKVKIEYN